MSLPSRIPFIVAAANTPILVVGQKDSAAAKFVQEYNLGSVCDYTAASFLAEILQLRTYNYQLKLRQASHQLASSLKADHFDDWLWRSLEQRQPIDDRFAIFQNHYICGHAVITPCEVNQQHGTGPVKRIFADNRQIISIRSADHYGGEQDFGPSVFFSITESYRERKCFSQC